MAPFDFNYVQDDLLSVVAERSPLPVRAGFHTPEITAPTQAVIASHPRISATQAPVALLRDDNTLRAVAAGRAATIRYDTEIETHSFTEILLEFLDRNATLTSVGFIICYVGVLRAL